MRIKIWFKRARLKEGKGEDITEVFFEKQIERVFNFIGFIDKKHIRFDPLRKYF